MDALKNRFLGQPETPEQLKAIIDDAVKAEIEACADVADESERHGWTGAIKAWNERVPNA